MGFCGGMQFTVFAKGIGVGIMHRACKSIHVGRKLLHLFLISKRRKKEMKVARGEGKKKRWGGGGSHGNGV